MSDKSIQEIAANGAAKRYYVGVTYGILIA